RASRPRLPRREPRRSALRRHRRRAGTARSARSQHPARHDTDFAGPRHRPARRNRLCRSGALDGGERRMRFMTARAEKRAKPAPNARSRRSRRWSRRQIAVVAGAGMLLVASGASWWLERSGAIAAAEHAATERFYAFTARCGLAVEDVQVEGRARTSRQAILNALAIGRGTPILALDPVEAKRRLESLAWVRNASVERRLPDALYIRLVERQPLAFWHRDGVVVPSDHLDRFGNLIVLVGADAPQAGGALIDMLASEPELAAHVAAA